MGKSHRKTDRLKENRGKDGQGEGWRKKAEQQMDRKT